MQADGEQKEEPPEGEPPKAAMGPPSEPASETEPQPEPEPTEPAEPSSKPEPGPEPSSEPEVGALDTSSEAFREAPMLQTVRVVVYDSEHGTSGDPEDVENVDINAPLVELITEIDDQLGSDEV